MSWISSAHHILCIKHLLSKLRNCKRSILLRASWCQRSKSNHEEMQTRERNQINSQFSQIRIQLTWESQTTSNSRHSSWYKMVQISVSRSCELKSSKANIVKSLVINNHAQICIFNQLMDRKSSIIRLNNCIRYLRRWHDWKSLHYSIRIFLSYFRNKQSSHSTSGSSSKRVSNLKPLKTITAFSLFSHNIKYRINQFSTFSLMPFSPIIPSTCLAKNKVIWSKKLAKRTGSHRIHCTWFQIH